MIANFTLMGSLYKHREYSTIATEWNTYPWVLGADNPITTSVSITDFYSQKMFLNSEEGQAIGLSASISDFVVNAFTTIRIDNLGNFGKDSVLAPNPDPIPRGDSRSTFPEGIVVSNLTTKLTLIVHTQHENKRDTIPVDIVVSEIDSREVLKVHLLDERYRDTIPVDIIFELEE